MALLPGHYSVDKLRSRRQESVLRFQLSEAVSRSRYLKAECADKVAAHLFRLIEYVDKQR